MIIMKVQLDYVVMHKEGSSVDKARTKLSYERRYDR